VLRQTDFQEQGLLLQAFELGAILVEKKAVRFYPRGFCMFPCIRPGDAIHIEPRNIERMAVGDVAVFRRKRKLFAHRVIQIGEKDGACFIVTCPDKAQQGDDGPSVGADVLGVVTSVERGGKMFDTAPRCYVGMTRAWLGLQYEVHKFKERVYTVLTSMVRSCCDKGWYRFLASMLFIHTPVSFTLAAPLGREGADVFFRKITIAQLKEKLSGWRLMVKVGGRPAGYVSFKPGSDKWEVDEVCLRLRYCATSVERRMWQEISRAMAQAISGEA
jgi:hypothetical protein